MVHPVLVDRIPRLAPLCLVPTKPCSLMRAELTRFGQLGTSFGLAITTIIFNSALETDSRSLGVDLDVPGSAAPRAAQLHAYNHANWGAFAFGVLGKLTCSFPSLVSFVLSTCGGSLGCPIRPERAKLEKLAQLIMSCVILNLAGC